jgi:Cu+-exporting ATPase
VFAEQLPQGKAKVIEELQRAGKRVAFVGDGLNDAPALAQADVGVAIGTGTDIAIESGDVVLMRGDLNAFLDARAMSQAALTTIRQNFFWAYAYNAALIPVAAGVLYPVMGLLLSPMLAAAAMSFSSLFVLGNSLRLRRFHTPSTPTSPEAPPTIVTEKLAMKETHLQVDGMTCSSCVRHVDKALRGLAGVDRVDIELKDGRVTVHHDPAKAPVSALIEAVHEAGYAARAAGEG